MLENKKKEDENGTEESREGREKLRESFVFFKCLFPDFIHYISPVFI